MILSLNRILNNKLANQCLRIAYHILNPSKIIKLGQKAILASKLIEQIAKPRGIQQIKYGSLTKHLIKTINDSKVQNQQAKSQLLSLFTTGIPINTQIFDQDRHKDQIYRLLKFQNGVPKMIFSPTSVVTGQIFKKLINQQQLQTYNLFMGHYGISKTISLQLYWYLSNIISQYLIESKDSQNQTFQEVKNFPKLIYLNINFGDSVETMRNKILTQCKQLSDKINNQQFLKSQFPTKRIKDIYKTYGMQVILTVDQLNQYANLLRSYLQNEINKNQVIKPLINKQKQTHLTGQQLQILQSYYNPSKQIERKQVINKVAQFSLMISLVGKNFDRYLYFSSINLQEKIIEKLNLAYSKHNKLYHKRAEYLQLLSLKPTIYQLIDYFLFEIQQRFSIFFHNKTFFRNCIDEGIVRQILFRHLNKKSQQYILTPYLISNYLIDNKLTVQNILSKIISDFNMKQRQCQRNLSFDKKIEILQPLLRDLTNLIDSIIDSINLDLTKKFSTFLKKLSKENQYKIVNQILFGYFRTNKTTNMLERFQINLNVAENGVQIFKSCIDKRIFYKDAQNKIYSFFPKKLLLKIVQPLENASILYMLNNYTHNQIEGLYKRDEVGKYFQKVFIQAILIQNVQVQFQSIITKFTPFDSKVLGFIPIPQGKKQMENFNFLLSFSKYVRYLNSKSEKKYTMFLPLNPQYQDEQFAKKVIQGDQNIQMTHIQLKNKLIDFIIIRNPQIQQNLRINCFDLTISTTIQSKIINFLEYYQNFQKSTQSQINWEGQFKRVLINFYVISNEKEIKNLKKKLDEKFKGKFRFIQSSCKNTLQVKYLSNQSQKYVGIIGSLYFGKQDLKITNSTVPNEEFKNILFFDKLMKVIEKYQKRNKK